MKKSAKPRSLTGILNTDDSSVVFLQHPSFFVIPRSSPLDSFARELRSSFASSFSFSILLRLELKSDNASLADAGTWHNVVIARSPRHLRSFGAPFLSSSVASPALRENRGRRRPVLSMVLSFKDASSRASLIIHSAASTREFIRVRICNVQSALEQGMFQQRAFNAFSELEH